MASTPYSPLLEELGDRAFSFYPPIVNVEHNEWVYRQGNWSEVLVFNPRSSIEVWIPRSYLGEISRIEDPVSIVGLRRELEYKGGAVWPYTRRVLSMPSAASAVRNDPVEPEPGEAAQGSMAAAVGELRSSVGAESGIGKLIGAAVIAGVVLCFIGVGVLRLHSTGGTIEYKTILQADLGLTSDNDYFDVVHKIGPPEQDKWKPNGGERVYRALFYPKKDLIIILMGAEKETAHYIGAKDSQWRTVHTVDLGGGKNTESMMRVLQPF